MSDPHAQIRSHFENVSGVTGVGGVPAEPSTG